MLKPEPSPEVRELVFIKLGGSLITDKSKPYTARREVIDRLSAEIRGARDAHALSLVVGHGGGSFPHVSASRYQTHLGVVDDRSWEGFIEVHDDAVKLNRIVCEALAAEGVLAYPVQPSAACVARKSHIEEWYERPIELLLQAGLIPVVYGDVCLDEEQGLSVISTEEIFRRLAMSLCPSRIILVGKVDGVLDDQGRVVPRITDDNFAVLRDSLLASDGVADVTGGMLHKVERSLQLDLPTKIINGLEPGRLERALLGEDVPGTIIG